MSKLFSILLLSSAFIIVPTFAAQDVITGYDRDYNTYDISDEYNFNSSSYLTDEQLQEAQEIDEIDDKSGFDAKIINSSHFSSDTATKTWIPINKVK